MEIPSGASALVSKSMFNRGLRTSIDLLPNPLAGSGVVQQSLNLHIIVFFYVDLTDAGLIVSMYFAYPRTPADEFARRAGGDDPSAYP